MSDLRRGICVLRNKSGEAKGFVTFKETSYGGPTQIYIYAEDLSPGGHGAHIHKSGNSSEGSRSLCAHFNPTNKNHGGRNDPNAHVGDCGNIYANEAGIAEDEFLGEFIRLRGETESVVGRSFIVHEDEDDLGRGDYEDSKTTGHSGKRILWGIIGIDETC